MGHRVPSWLDLWKWNTRVSTITCCRVATSGVRLCAMMGPRTWPLRWATPVPVAQGKRLDASKPRSRIGGIAQDLARRLLMASEALTPIFPQSPHAEPAPGRSVYRVFYRLRQCGTSRLTAWATPRA